MSIPIPDLDDRRFQDLVDTAKRRVADRCPEWTDHNVSDPGVTLIELFAQMVDETLYRVNRIPELMLIRLMNAVGLRLQPSRAASTRLTFWLAAPTRYWAATAEDSPTLAPSGVEVATERRGQDPPVSFRTTEELLLRRAEVVARHTMAASRDGGPGRLVPREGEQYVAAFGEGVPTPGAALVLELVRAVPGCAVRIEVDCQPNHGTGIRPSEPPWAWEAWCRDRWQECEVDRDTTGGLNRPGSIYLHVPPGHTAAPMADRAGTGWLRCRLAEPRPGQSFYEDSPSVGRVTAETLGVSVEAAQADTLVRNEVVGVSDGTYGQPPFPVGNTPVVDDDSGGPLLLAGDDPVPWTPVPGFEHSQEDDRHYVLDRVAGRVLLGVAVRQADGRMRRYAAVPPASSPLRLAEYRVGGGVRGNVRATALRVLKSPIPHVRAVENRHAATGGVDPESVEEAMVRLPLFLRQRTKAVTLSDFAELAREASFRVARSHAYTDSTSALGLAVRVVVVPTLPPDVSPDAPVSERDVALDEETLTEVTRFLDERRLLGVQVLVTPPRWVPFRVTASVSATTTADHGGVEREAQKALNRQFHPLLGGDDGSGWPFGRDVQGGDVYAALHRVPGVSRVESVALVDSGGHEVSRLSVPVNGLPLALGHVVAVA